MVVFSLEQALGTLIKDKHSASPGADTNSTIDDILARSTGGTPKTRSQRVSRAIAESYLDELLRISVSLAAGTDAEPHLTKLRDLIHAVGMLEVRNAVAHPNRDFPENFWYRCALVATSSPITHLNLISVTTAYQAAISDKISLPPDEWFQIRPTTVPTNLPTHSDHDITGLIGRNREKSELLKLIRNRRFPLIIVTGPGGLGKTALTIQSLREYVQDYSVEPSHDAVVFCSLKQEKLTAAGVEILSASQSINELRSELFEELIDIFPNEPVATFDELTSSLCNSSVLLFVDNLETLLRDSPDQFQAFADDLPRDWTLVATSRVAVDSAKSIPLATLSLGDATGLAFRYAQSKGLELDSSAADKIATASQCNPLALRLAIDQLSNGANLAEATRQAQKDVVQFSFKNLIETLPNHCRRVLECLFVQSPMGRGEIISTLGLSADEAVESARRLGPV